VIAQDLGFLNIKYERLKIKTRDFTAFFVTGVKPKKIIKIVDFTKIIQK